MVGDLDELRSRDSAYADETGHRTEGELLDAAVAALAEVLVLRDKELDERTEERARPAELEREVGQSPEAGLVQRLRRATARLTSADRHPELAAEDVAA